MRNTLVNYEYYIHNNIENEFILEYKKKYFKISELVYSVLLIGKNENDLENILLKLNKPTLTINDLEIIINNKILPLFNRDIDLNEKKHTELWIQKTIFSEKTVKKLASPFSFLFGKLFYPIFIILIFINIYLSFFTSINNLNTDIFESNYLILILNYLCLFVIIFLHELGHASASIASKVTPRSIGVGLYIILPTMYTDLTDIWKLDKKSKIKINLGGIFVQLIINVIIFITLKYTSSSQMEIFLKALFYTNTFIVLLNLIPFLKFDGYWVLSDYLSISNLIQVSNNKIKSVFIKKDPFKEKINTNYTSKEIFIIIYTILRLIYIIITILLIFTFIIFSFLKTYLFISNLTYMNYDINFFKELIYRLINLIILYLFTRNYTKSFFNYVKSKKNANN